MILADLAPMVSEAHSRYSSLLDQAVITAASDGVQVGVNIQIDKRHRTITEGHVKPSAMGTSEFPVVGA